MSQSTPLRSVPIHPSVSRPAPATATAFAAEQTHEPTSSPVPNGVQRLPSLVLPEKRVSSERRGSDSVLRTLFVGGVLLALGIFLSRTFSSEIGAAPAPTAAGGFAPQSVAEAHSGARCDGTGLRSRMCEVAWQGSLVGGF